MKVFLLPEVEEYIDDLGYILYEKEYFVFEEYAQKYVDDLFYELKTKLHIYPSKPAPKYFDKFGKNMNYTGFRKNRNTTWYVFFDTYKVDDEIIYLVRYIANNHTVAQYL